MIVLENWRQKEEKRLNLRRLGGNRGECEKERGEQTS